MAGGNGFHPVARAQAWFGQTRARADLLTALGGHVGNAFADVSKVTPLPRQVEVVFPQTQWESLQSLPNGMRYPAVFALREFAGGLGRPETDEKGEKIFKFSMPAGDARELASALRWAGTRAELLDMTAGVALGMLAVATFAGLIIGAREVLGLSWNGGTAADFGWW